MASTPHSPSENIAAFTRLRKPLRRPGDATPPFKGVEFLQGKY